MQCLECLAQLNSQQGRRDILESNSNSPSVELIRLQSDVRVSIKNAKAALEQLDDVLRKKVVKFKKKVARKEPARELQAEIEKHSAALVTLKGRFEDSLKRERGDLRFQPPPLKTLE